MSNNDPTATPLLDSIDDPSGLRTTIPEDESDPGNAAAYFARTVQGMRWELHALMVDLDAIEGLTPPTTMLLPHIIDLLGVVARSEAAYHDLPDDQDIAAARLFVPAAR